VKVDVVEFCIVSFLAGITFMIVMDFCAEPDRSPHKEAVLPKKCYVGQKVVMTTAAKAEYYECEASWVRK
jgi:hypothetical protein